MFLTRFSCRCRTERSTDQVIKPINLEALTKWVTAIPDDVKRDMASIAPMLERLGYDPQAYPPNYGNPDAFVAENTDDIRSNEDFWRKRGLEIATMTKPKWSYNEKEGGAAGNHGNVYKDAEDGGGNNKDTVVVARLDNGNSIKNKGVAVEENSDSQNGVGGQDKETR